MVKELSYTSLANKYPLKAVNDVGLEVLNTDHEVLTDRLSLLKEPEPELSFAYCANSGSVLSV